MTSCVKALQNHNLFVSVWFPPKGKKKKVLFNLTLPLKYGITPQLRHITQIKPKTLAAIPLWTHSALYRHQPDWNGLERLDWGARYLEALIWEPSVPTPLARQLRVFHKSSHSLMASLMQPSASQRRHENGTHSWPRLRRFEGQRRKQVNHRRNASLGSEAPWGRGSQIKSYIRMMSFKA